LFKIVRYAAWAGSSRDDPVFRIVKKSDNGCYGKCVSFPKWIKDISRLGGQPAQTGDFVHPQDSTTNLHQGFWLSKTVVFFEKLEAARCGRRFS
jgi:hypothetical protein